MIDYKHTLNLPYTEFPMRANLPILELNSLHRWHTDDLYKIIRNKKNKKKCFVLHDGPPYANGNIHLGHAVNKILKDIIIKFKGLSGYNAPYIPGWDCHGLPIELKVEQLIKNNNNYVNNKDFRKICRQYVLKQIEIQKKDFIRLGVIGDWNNPYLTMDFKTEANIIRSLNKVIFNGYIYKGVKPVYWCFKCGSALSSLEVEYRNHCSYAVDIGFSVVDKYNIKKIFNVDNISMYSKNVELIIWTTTLWTIPANAAIAVRSDYIYQLIQIMESSNRCIIIAANLVNIVMKRLKCCNWKVLGESLGKYLENLEVYHPFMSFTIPIILSNHVNLDSGTGIVHIAPNYGPDDYVIAKQYKLKNIINLIDDQGYYMFDMNIGLKGQHIFKSNDFIIKLLRKSNNLLCINPNYEHSYPYCWRHITPLIFRATSQWFLNMDHDNFKSKLLKLVQGVSWFPEKGLSHIRSMIINRPDWCISRQRIWGIPIPVLIHKDTENFHPNTFKLIEKIAQLVEKNGIQAWWDLKVEDLLKKEEAVYYRKINDTLDVWFDSGSTYDAVMVKEFNFVGKSGVDLYLEGSDQYRGWFMSSLIISVAINGFAPYKNVLSHGFTVDSEGNKMSKSIGNVISPQDIVNKFGSDILRLWIASSNYSKEMTISNNILQHVTDIYRRIRNTIRFCLSNLHDFNPTQHLVRFEDMVELDRWIVNRAFLLQLKIISNYKEYQFHYVIKHVMNFCTTEMSSFYLDIIKDRQYTFKKDSIARRSCQTALYHIIEAMVRWIVPVLPFTADEVWKYIPGKREKYVFTEEWYDGLFATDSNQYINQDIWKIFFKIRNKVNKVIEHARINGIIKGSLEAEIVLYIDSSVIHMLHTMNNELAFGLLVSSVIILNYDNFYLSKSDTSNDDMKLKVILKKAAGIKCLRCWNYTLKINQYKDYFNICSRCVENIVGSGENRKYF